MGASREHLPVVLLILGLLAVSSTLAVWVIGPLPVPTTAMSLPWWAVAIGFALAESFVVNLHFRSESGSFSLLELPLVFGLLFTRPVLLWVAMIVGAAVGLTAIRRQPLLKVAFNVSNLSLQVAVAALIFAAVRGSADPLGPIGWLALLAATTLSAILQISLINLVIWLTERRISLGRAWSMTGFGSIVAAANTVQGLIAALIIVAEPWGVLLLTGSTGVLFLAYRAYVSERHQRERVEFLHQSTRALRTGREATTAADALLAEATTMFRARMAELVFFSAPEADEPPARFSRNGGTADARSIDESDETEAAAVAEIAERPLLVVDGVAPRPVVDYLADRGVGDALVAMLRSDQRPIGLFVVGDRLGSVTTFTAEDLRLFTTLVDQAAVAFENDQLEQALARLRSLESELAYQARYDSLTGLANRNLFNTRLDELVGGDPDVEVDVLYVDLDDFKLVNDRLGHASGDALLKEVARRLTDSVRPEDVVARLGGDEFGLLLISPGDSTAVAHRIIGGLSTPFQLGADEVRIGASVGIARRLPDTDTYELLHQADRAMYTAKERGKGSVVEYSTDLRRDDAHQQLLQTALRRGIIDEEFEVVYQPIVRLDDLAVIGAEALVRWQQRSGPLLRPSDFIAEAERSGLILSIDRLVRLAVFDQVDELAAAAGRDFFASINLSARNLQQPDLVDQVRADLTGRTANAGRIVFEITESAFVGDVAHAARVLDDLRRLGLRIALDDFGTGFSSLSYLRNLPIDVLKIAQPFIADLATGVDTAFVEAMISLSRTLGLTVVAEGIENDLALNTLLAMGCELGQGFHFARPMAAETLVEVLRQRSRV